MSIENIELRLRALKTKRTMLEPGLALFPFSNVTAYLAQAQPYYRVKMATQKKAIEKEKFVHPAVLIIQSDHDSFWYILNYADRTWWLAWWRIHILEIHLDFVQRTDEGYHKSDALLWRSTDGTDNTLLETRFQIC